MLTQYLRSRTNLAKALHSISLTTRHSGVLSVSMWCIWLKEKTRMERSMCLEDSTNSTKWGWSLSKGFRAASFLRFPTKLSASSTIRSPISDKDISMISSERWPNYLICTIAKNSRRCFDQNKKIWAQPLRNGPTPQLQISLISTKNTLDSWLE